MLKKQNLMEVMKWKSDLSVNQYEFRNNHGSTLVKAFWARCKKNAWGVSTDGREGMARCRYGEHTVVKISQSGKYVRNLSVDFSMKNGMQL